MYACILESVICKLLFLSMESCQQSTFIGLNVGGQVYFTTLSTLRSDLESRLGRMFSGNFNQRCAKDKEGNFLIDADGPLFRYVLGFMRHDRLDLPKGFKDIGLLESEAAFYQNWRLSEAVINNRPDFDPARIYIIVEGKCFSESRSTLMGNKTFVKSFLAQMVKYRSESNPSRNVFTIYRRNAESFRYLWQFIQDGSFDVADDDDESRAEALVQLREEVPFYKIDELATKIETELSDIYGK